jgi:hypothetical protein
MPTRRSHHGTLAALTATVVLLTGACKPETSAQGPTPDASATATKPASNGLASKSPREILAATAIALRGAKSVHMKGTTVDGHDVIGLDMTLARNAASGKMRGPVNGKMVLMQVISVGGRLYLRGPQLWQAVGGQAAARRIGSRWVITPQAGAPDVAFLSLSAFAKQVLKPKGKVVKGKPAVIAGQPVITLIDSGDRSVLYVAATGEPYPLRMAQAGGKRHVDLAGYNVPVTIARPASALDFRTAVGA